MKKLIVIVISVLVAGLVLLGGTVWAFAQGNNIIYACVAKDGTIRIVALTGQCKDKETPLQWNIQGEPGPQGPSGVLGFYQKVSEVNVPPSSLNFGATARCDIGDKVTGGGWRWLLPYNRVEIGSGAVGETRNTTVAADPVNNLGEGWRVNSYMGDGSELILEVTAICADLTP